MNTYTVSGYAMIPILVEVDVNAENEERAIELAKQEFKLSKNRRQFVIANSEDDSAVHDWQPYEATLARRQPT